jgi:hypothetical protein
MNCAEFRREYQFLVDRKETDNLTPEMSIHVAGCPACDKFARAMKAVDGALREQPRFEISKALMLDLLAIPLNEMREEFALKRYVQKALTMILSGVGLVVVGMFVLPPGVSFWIRFCVLTAGLAFFWINALKEKRLTVPLE